MAVDEIFVFQPEKQILKYNGEGRSNNDKSNSLFFFNKVDNGEPISNISDSL
jgi:hypothetical protein